MAGSAYHNETLRKQRLIDRKSEAMRKMQEGLGQSGDIGVQESKQSPLMFSETGHYAQNRSGNVQTSLEKKEVVFEEVVHDPNFRYRMLKASGGQPEHVDPIYKIMYPGTVTRNPNDKERIRHRRRRAENEGEDKVMPLLHPPEYNFTVPLHELPPRKPHFKV